MSRTVAAELDFRGPSGYRGASLTGVRADGARELVLLLAGEQSAGVTFDDQDNDAQLIIGVTGSRAVLSVMTPAAAFDRLNLDVESDRAEEVLILGGVATTFEARQVVDVETAAEITRQWVAGESRPPGPEWSEN